MPILLFHFRPYKNAIRLCYVLMNYPGWLSLKKFLEEETKMVGSKSQGRSESGNQSAVDNQDALRSLQCEYGGI